MALVIADRIKETTTTSGTSDFVLAGAVTGFSTFSSALSNSDTTYYVCVEGSDYEVGLGTFVSGTTTLQRTTVLASTNSGSKVSFSSSAKEIFITYPADKAIYLDGSDNLIAANGSALTNLNASNLASGTVADARLPATISSDITGNAATATALATGRTIALSGDVAATGVSFDGTSNITLTTTIQANSVALGTDTTGNYVADITAGSAIDVSGGGSETATVTINVDLSELTTSTTDGDGDFFVVVDASNVQRKLTKGNINISGFNNDSGFTTSTGTVTSVSGGNGLTGSITTSGSLAVGAGTGIDVTADEVSVDVSDFMTNGANNRVLTATGTDAMNGEANLTFDGSNLNISGNINAVDDIYLADQIIHEGDTNNYFQFHAADQQRHVVGGTERLEIKNSSPHVLVTGTLNATTDVQINGSSAATTGKAIAMAIVFGG